MYYTYIEEREGISMPIRQILEIRNSMVPSKRLLQNHFPIILDSESVEQTNCYGYCLGIKHSSIKFRPGFTVDSDTDAWKDNPKELLEECIIDLQNLNRPFRKIALDDVTFVEENEYFIDVHSSDSCRSLLPSKYTNFENKWAELLAPNEYLIKVFYTPSNCNLKDGDFHFIRQDRQTGLWFHKMGWYRQPDLVRSDNGFWSPVPGREPTKITSIFHSGFSYAYEPLAYFAITEPY